MMPVVPTAKRSHGFTIDSLMGKDTPPPSRPRSRSRSPPDSHSHQRPSHHHQHPASSSASTSPSSTCGGERGVSSSVPINLTASAEAATVPLREGGLFGVSGPGGLASSFHPVHSTNAALLSSMKSLYGHEHAYPDGLTAAAALGFPVPLAATTANGLPPGLPAAFSPAAGPHHPALHGAPHPLLLGAGAAHREHFSLYPWLMSRHGGYFGHGRFPGPDASHLLLQPFRKPKRIRTAFSPSQLLRLEHAFEKNHYVVGQERKDLAVNLSLTETQVKVWFQNRRTKYKRMKAEEAESDRGGGVKDGSKAPGSPRSDSSDKPLDVSSCPEDDEEEEELEMELVDEDMEGEEEEIIDCVTSPEDASSSNRNHGNPAILRYDPHHPHHHPHHPAHHLPRPPVDPLDHHSHHSDSSPGGGQGGGQGQGQIHNHQVGQGNNHTSSPQGQSRPPRSPSPNAAKTAHHVERWRSETNQMQAV